jgi:5-formyltetrahydrofolate cyclo-ligase
MSKEKLRRSMRAARRALSDAERRRAARELCRHLTSSPWYRDSRTLAAYLAADGEIDLQPLIDAARGHGKRVCLPVIAAGPALRFAVFEHGTPLHPNRHGIAEPRGAGVELVAPRELDLVLAPLVAFDPRGHRIGMGAGFYDRTFAFLNERPKPERPLLIGAAYELQRAPAIEPEPWDVPLSGIATEQGIYDPQTDAGAS